MLEYFLLFFFAISIAFPILHSIHCLPYFQKKYSRQEDIQTDIKKGISILVPCYNEQDIIETSIRSMKNLLYSDAEVIYINDGSSDRTLILLNKMLKLTPFYNQVPGNLWIIRK